MDSWKVHTGLSKPLSGLTPLPRWTQVLPFVLLGLRSIIKEDINTTAAEQVYGATIRLPSDFSKIRAVTDHSVTSRTIAQHIASATCHSASGRTIRRHLQQSGLSARRPLLGLPLTQNHRRPHGQWCDERRMWAAELNEVVLLTSHASVCNTTMVGFESGDTVERRC
ncbi:uncharacterized protein TNCV_2500701 [Trichonephila clavipes]|nr:uncharacterized protein TNCV_2500701 [Trichonephila clavipes]